MKAFSAGVSGATAIEYALIACLVSIAIVGALNFLGSQMATLFVSISVAMP